MPVQETLMNTIFNGTIKIFTSVGDEDISIDQLYKVFKEREEEELRDYRNYIIKIMEYHDIYKN